MARFLGIDDAEELKCQQKATLLHVRQLLPQVYALRDGHLPGDVEATIEHATVSKPMFQAEPGTEILSLLGKYKPWKDALFSSWKADHRGRRGCAAVWQFDHAARAQAMLPVLVAALHCMDGDPQQVWSDNCGRKVGRILGWLPMCSRLKLLKHDKDCTESQRRGKALLHLGAHGLPYRLLPHGEGLVLVELAKIAKAGDIFTSACRHHHEQPCNGCQRSRRFPRIASPAQTPKIIWGWCGALNCS